MHTQIKIHFCFILVLIGFLILVIDSGSKCQDLDYPDSLIQKLDENNLVIGNLRLNSQTREILVPGHINMNSDLIEYFAVTAYGKTHEAVVVLDIQPMHLQLGLLLLGLEYGQNLGFQGDTVMPLGDSVYIYLGWLDENQDTTIYEISELIVDYQNNQPMPSTAWIFTGSFLHDGHYMADMDGSIIATYSDPVAILNNPLSGRMDDTVYGANERLLPPAGTPVFMKIITR